MKLLILENVWVSGRPYSAGDIVDIAAKDEYQTLILGRHATNDAPRIAEAEKKANTRERAARPSAARELATA